MGYGPKFRDKNKCFVHVLFPVCAILRGILTAGVLRTFMSLYSDKDYSTSFSSRDGVERTRVAGEGIFSHSLSKSMFRSEGFPAGLTYGSVYDVISILCSITKNGFFSGKDSPENGSFL